MIGLGFQLKSGRNLPGCGSRYAGLRALIFHELESMTTPSGASYLLTEEAYRIVQRQAMRVLKLDIDFSDALLSEARVRRLLGKAGVGKLCRLKSHAKHINRIFRRFGLS